MPEEVKEGAKKAAKILEQVPENKLDLYSMFAETFANGLAAGQAIAKENQRKEAES